MVNVGMSWYAAYCESITVFRALCQRFNYVPFLGKLTALQSLPSV